MRKQAEKIRDIIFIITVEKDCPFYTVGEELKIENAGLSLSSYKPACLYLAESLKEIISRKVTGSIFTSITGHQKSRYQCPGCSGRIEFEYKKDKDFATLQMKLLRDAQEQARKKHLNKFFGILRDFAFFQSLDDDALVDLTLLLEFKSIPSNKIIINRDNPVTHLFIILSGKVAIISERGDKLGELKSGDIFGELNLLSGEPAAHSMHTVDATRVAMLSNKNFKYVLKKFPVLQLFLLKMLADRAQTMSLRSGHITSGMSGELAEIHAVDLFQLIHSSNKTGIVHLILDQGRARVVFRNGEIILAEFLEVTGKQALFALLQVKNGHFIYTSGISSEQQELAPIGRFMGMLMEGLQRMDEIET
ncbi:MAG: Crp/Fnr family transcriptional regulator [Desulfocapsa sp.]|nr:MAG: Crp/Fnr family transcriptional regulator [Desulfocapsa sp.]